MKSRIHTAGRLITSLLLSYSAAAIGSLATTPSIPSWYAGLEKPLFNPPNIVFGPVWTLLYALVGIALYLVWIKESSLPKRRAYIFWGLQLFLNTLWSIVFFGLHIPWLGVIVIILLILAIVGTILSFYSHSKVAAYLLIPYLLWVCFATYLSVSIALLNP